MLQISNANLWEGVKGGDCLIAHGCNAIGTMGRGFAAQLRVKFPLAFLEYRSMCLSNRIKVGEWQIVHERTYAILNAITQETYGNDPNVVYVDYPSVEKGMRVAQVYCHLYNKVAHFPLIGGGLANGDKDRLIGIFEDVFKSTNAVLYIPTNTGK